MAKIYKREKSSYWWAAFKSPSGQRIRRSTGITNQDALVEKAQLQANQMELECWQDWSPGKEAVQSRSFEDLAVDYLKAKRPGRAHLDGIKALRGYFAGMELNGLGKQDVANYIA